jgi:hypothetical protein
VRGRSFRVKTTRTVAGSVEPSAERESDTSRVLTLRSLIAGRDFAVCPPTRSVTTIRHGKVSKERRTRCRVELGWGTQREEGRGRKMRNAVCYVATAEPFGVLRRFVQPLSSASPMWRSAAWKGTHGSGQSRVRHRSRVVVGRVATIHPPSLHCSRLCLYPIAATQQLHSFSASCQLQSIQSISTASPAAALSPQ